MLVLGDFFLFLVMALVIEEGLRSFVNVRHTRAALL